jgi:hypothetical protein
VLKLLTIAVLAFAAVTLGAMGVIYVVTSEPATAAARPPPRAEAAVAGAPAAPLIVLPPPAAAAPPYVPPPNVEIVTLAPPPPVSAEPAQRAADLLAFREVRRGTAMDQLNAREALRRQRLGLPPPAPAPQARTTHGARRPGAAPELGTP